jgi:two-component system response regulator NreC
VLILDVMLPSLNGLDVLPIVRQRAPRTATVVFSMYANEDFVRQALKNGAAGYVLKGCDPAETAAAVRCVAGGGRHLCAALAGLAEEQPAPAVGAAPADRHDLLTPRERQAIQLAAEGHSSAEIGKALYISPRTVEMHRAKAMHKLGLKSQAELIRYAIRKGMIPADM